MIFIFVVHIVCCLSPPSFFPCLKTSHHKKVKSDTVFFSRSKICSFFKFFQGNRRLESPVKFLPLLTAESSWYQQTFLGGLVVHTDLYNKLAQSAGMSLDLPGNDINIERALVFIMEKEKNGETVSYTFEDLLLDQIIELDKGSVLGVTEVLKILKDIQTDHLGLFDDFIGLGEGMYRLLIEKIYSRINKLREQGTKTDSTESQKAIATAINENIWDNLNTVINFNTLDYHAGFVSQWIAGDIAHAKLTYEDFLKSLTVDHQDEIFKPLNHLINNSDTEIELNKTVDERIFELGGALYNSIDIAWYNKEFLSTTTMPLSVRLAFKRIKESFLSKISSIKEEDLNHLTISQQDNLIKMACLFELESTLEHRQIINNFFKIILEDYQRVTQEIYKDFKFGSSTHDIGHHSMNIVLDLYVLQMMSEDDLQLFMLGFLYKNKNYNEFIHLVNTNRIEDKLAEQIISQYVKAVDSQEAGEFLSKIIYKLAENFRDNVQSGLNKTGFILSPIFKMHQQDLGTIEQVLYIKLIKRKILLGHLPQNKDKEQYSFNYKHLDNTDLMGYEEEPGGIFLRANEKAVNKKTLATIHSENEGLPKISIELDTVDINDHIYIEIVSAPLRPQDYQDPVYLLFKKVWKDSYLSAKKGDSIQTVIDRYNQKMRDILGVQSDDYILNPNKDINLSKIIFLKDVKLSKSGIQVTLNIKIETIGTQDFIDSMKITSLYDVGLQTDRATNTIMLSLDPNHTMASEVRSLIYEVCFNEIQTKELGIHFDQDKISYRLLFRFSPEDIVFGVLSDEDLTKLKEWYKGTGKELIKKSIQDQFIKENQENWENSRFVNARLESIFNQTITSRLKGSKKQLTVYTDSYLYSGFSEGYEGDVVNHSLPFRAVSRVPLGLNEGEYYGAVEFRFLDQSSGDWTRKSLEALKSLNHLESVDFTSEYGKFVNRFIVSLEGTLALWEERPIRKSAFDYLVSLIPKEPLESDPQSAIWNAFLSETMKKLIKKVQEKWGNVDQYFLKMNHQLEHILTDYVSFNLSNEKLPLNFQKWLFGILSTVDFFKEFYEMEFEDQMTIINGLLEQKENSKIVDFLEELSTSFDRESLSDLAYLRLSLVREKVRLYEIEQKTINEETDYVVLEINNFELSFIQYDTEEAYSYIDTEGTHHSTEDHYEVTNYAFSFLEEGSFVENQLPYLTSETIEELKNILHIWRSQTSDQEKQTYIDEVIEKIQRGYLENEYLEPIWSCASILKSKDGTIQGIGLYGYDNRNSQGVIDDLLKRPSSETEKTYLGQERSFLLNATKDLQARLSPGSITFEAITSEEEEAGRSLCFFDVNIEEKSVFRISLESSVSDVTALQNIIKDRYQNSHFVLENLGQMKDAITNYNKIHSDEPTPEIDNQTKTELSILLQENDLSENLDGLNLRKLKERFQQLLFYEKKTQEIAYKMEGQNKDFFDKETTLSTHSFSFLEGDPQMSISFYKLIDRYEVFTGTTFSEGREANISYVSMRNLLEKMLEYMNPDDFVTSMTHLKDESFFDISDTEASDVLLDFLVEKEESHSELVLEVKKFLPESMASRIPTTDDIYTPTSDSSS